MERIDVSHRSTPSLVFELQPLWRRLPDASHHDKVNIHRGTCMTCGFTALTFSGAGTEQSRFRLCRWQLPRVTTRFVERMLLNYYRGVPNREGGNWHRQQPCPFFLTEPIVTNVLQEKYGVYTVRVCASSFALHTSALGFSLGVEDDTAYLMMGRTRWIKRIEGS